jgi:hypothetical protein
VSVDCVSTFNYGFDNQAFATTQAMNSFDKQFAEYNAKTKKYAIPPSWLSLFNSLNYIGFGSGMGYPLIQAAPRGLDSQPHQRSLGPKNVYVRYELLRHCNCHDHCDVHDQGANPCCENTQLSAPAQNQNQTRR